MEITHEFREYIIKDQDKRYSVKQNVKLNIFSVKEILINEHWGDRNSMLHVTDKDIEEKLKNLIQKNI